ncbi:rhomboid-like protein [Kitasatospora phosalacinea]|uniref:Rhomboid-like protein n=1 Tax=Kitasatospora phosalacinea TaxID=2065 RepID=A0ABW6GPR6_9ACTN
MAVPFPRPRHTVPVVFALLSATASALVVSLPDEQTRTQWEAWASTDLDNLADHPLGALLASAFVGGPSPWWNLALVSLGLFLLADRVGGAVAAGALVGGHVSGTLVSQGLAAVLISVGWAPEQLRTEPDVGSSYLLVAVLAALAASPSAGRVRVAAIGALVVRGPGLFVNLHGFSVPVTGHLVALAVGAAVARLHLRGAHGVAAPGPVAAAGNRVRV